MTASRAAAAPWLILYAALVTAPLVVAVLADPFSTPRPRRLEFAVALGFLALTLAVLQLALVSRVQSTSRRFGSDRLIALHRAAGVVVLLFVAAHAALLGGPYLWRALNPFGGPASARWGGVSFWAIVLVVASASMRHQVRLSYEHWRVLHVVGAALVVAAAIAHVVRVGGYAASAAMRWALLGYALLAAGLFASRWAVRPWRLASRPWVVAANDEVGASTRLLRLRPMGHEGFAFEAGQFAWLITGASAFSLEQHPLSMASSAARVPGDPLEFAVKALGDWSATVVPALRAGDRVWVDGPYGALTPRLSAETRLVLIAGGIGIAPMRAILLTMATGDRRRPVTLIDAAAHPARTPFTDDLEGLARVLPLDLVYVCEQPDAGWTGERGRVGLDLLHRRLGDPSKHEYLVCGPPGMIEEVTRDLDALGVPARRVRAERFHLV